MFGSRKKVKQETKEKFERKRKSIFLSKENKSSFFLRFPHKRNFFFSLILLLMLIQPVNSDFLGVRIRIIAGVPSLVGTLNFFDMTKPGIQNLSIIVTDNQNQLISNVTVNANITLPNGTIVNASFVESSTGNYTFFYNFTDIGDHTISVHLSRSDYISAAGSRTIHVGLVRFISFESESEVFQGSTLHFKFSAKNIGNVSSTIVPSFRIYDANGALVFAKEGVASTLEGNATQSLIQFNTMSWFVGSTAPGTYNASGRIAFTDPDNLTAYTPNKTLTFNVLQTTIAQPGAVGGGAVPAPTITKEVLLPPVVVELEPVREFMISYAPVLVEVYPLDIITVPVSMTNPLNKTITNISVNVKDLPSRWYFIPVDIIELGPGETRTIPVTFTIPLNAEIGNHPAAIVIQNHELRKETNYLLRVNQRTEVLPAVTYESAFVNELENITTYNIRIKNREDAIRTMNVIVRIDKSIAESVEEVVFVTEPKRIIQPDPIVEFEFRDMRPGEERNITYFVRKLVVDTSPFFYSAIEQIRFIEIKPLPAPVAVEEKYIYTGATIILIGIIAVAVITIIKRKQIEKALNEAKRAVQKAAKK